MNTYTINCSDDLDQYKDKSGNYAIEGHLLLNGELRITGSLEVKGYIKADRLIEAEGYIEAGWYIKAGESIEARGYIKAGGSITAGWYIKADRFIEAEGHITAGWYIKADRFIEAEGHIEAGWYIKAGESIDAGEYIFSFRYDIECKQFSTKTLPYWRDFWANMPPLRKYATEILKVDNCWDELRTLIPDDEKQGICEWDGWHKILRAQLEMFLGLKDTYKVPVTSPANR